MISKQLKHIPILLIVIAGVIVPLLSFGVFAPMIAGSRGPGGMNLDSFLILLPELVVAGIVIGYYRTVKYWLLCIIGVAAVTECRTYASATFWSDISHAPLLAVCWWAVAFTFGVVIGYWQSRRLTGTE